MVLEWHFSWGNLKVRCLICISITGSFKFLLYPRVGFGDERPWFLAGFPFDQSLVRIQLFLVGFPKQCNGAGSFRLRPGKAASEAGWPLWRVGRRKDDSSSHLVVEDLRCLHPNFSMLCFFFFEFGAYTIRNGKMQVHNPSRTVNVDIQLCSYNGWYRCRWSSRILSLLGTIQKKKQWHAERPQEP